MNIENPPDRVDYVKTMDGNVIRPKILEIGAWNMDNNITPKNVAHGLGSSFTKIISINVMIINDAGDYIHNIKGNCTYNEGAYISGIDDTNIIFLSVAGGPFDSANYDDTGINRGYVLIWVVE